MGTNSQFNIKTTHSCLSLRQRRLQPVHHSPRRVPLLLQGSLLRVMITYEYCHSAEGPFDSLILLCYWTIQTIKKAQNPMNPSL